MTDRTICNPVELPYRLQNIAMGPKRFTCREAADPSIVLFRDRYYLFLSMSGGFWHPADLLDCSFVVTPMLPTYDYAPYVHVVDGAMVLCASRASTCNLYRTNDPLSAGWEEIKGAFSF